MMRILINALILNSKNTGLGYYTLQILKYCVPLLDKEGFDIDILCRDLSFLPKHLENYAIIEKSNNFISRNLSVYKTLKNKYDLVWSTTQHGIFGYKGRQIITIHDIIPIKYPSGRLHQTFYYRFLIPFFIKNCVRIYTVSKYSKYDIENFYKADPRKVYVTYEALSSKNQINKSNEEIFIRLNITKHKYFVITGIHYRYKNIHSVIEAYLRSKKLHDYKIVIVGNADCSYGAELKKIVSENYLERKVIFSGFISENDKISLLVHAFAAIYPSLYEGFGLPLLEAMNVGIPVLASNSSSLPEVGGDAVLFFDGNDIVEIRTMMEKLVDNKELYSDLVAKGYENLKRFNWDLISRNILEDIKSILGSSCTSVGNKYK